MRTALIAAAILATVSTFSYAQVNSGTGNSTGGNNTAGDSDGGSAKATDGGATHHEPTQTRKGKAVTKPAAQGAHANSTGDHTTGTSLSTNKSGKSKSDAAAPESTGK